MGETAFVSWWGVCCAGEPSQHSLSTLRGSHGTRLGSLERSRLLERPSECRCLGAVQSVVGACTWIMSRP